MSYQDEIQKLIDYIEENLRATDETNTEFIDPRNYTNRLVNKQNHVIFGRRGSGKTLLIKTLRKKSDDYFYIKTNLEDYKHTSFPNIILHVSVQFLLEFSKILKKHAPWLKFWNIKKYRRLQKRIRAKIKLYNEQIQSPDKFDEQIMERKEATQGGDVFASYKGIGGSYSSSATGELKTERTFLRDKYDLIQNEISDLKQILKDSAPFTNGKSIFFGLDDFYFIKKSEQPFFIDFFHLLTKDTKLCLKVATIRYRSKLYTTSDTYVGTELGHDIMEIDMDYTLDRYDGMQSFMKDLLDEAINNSGAQLEITKLFSDNGLKQLCLASGGVPRDFLQLMVKLASGYASESKSISKIDVTEVAISNFENKLEAYAKDTAEEKEILDKYLQYLKEFLLNQKRTNIFLISNQDVENYPQINQAIKELMDLRMIHLVEPITSCAPSDGKKYSAYMIDIGLYPNSKPRSFDQIEPGSSDDKSRKDQIRSAPIINLQNFNESVDEETVQYKLELSAN